MRSPQVNSGCGVRSAQVRQQNWFASTKFLNLLINVMHDMLTHFVIASKKKCLDCSKQKYFAQIFYTQFNYREITDFIVHDKCYVSSSGQK